jgi:hypothetical protein
MLVVDVEELAKRYGMANYNGDWIPGVVLEASIHLAASRFGRAALGRRLGELLAETDDPFEALSALPLTVAIDRVFNDLKRQTEQ